MTTKDEALKLALEWLEYIDQQDNDRDFLGPEECCALDDTRNTIREALNAPLAEQPAQPLTDDKLADLWYKQSLDWMEFARAIEAAHGIKGDA